MSEDRFVMNNGRGQFQQSVGNTGEEQQFFSMNNMGNFVQGYQNPPRQLETTQFEKDFLQDQYDGETFSYSSYVTSGQQPQPQMFVDQGMGGNVFEAMVSLSKRDLSSCIRIRVSDNKRDINNSTSHNRAMAPNRRTSATTSTVIT